MSTSASSDSGSGDDSSKSDESKSDSSDSSSTSGSSESKHKRQSSARSSKHVDDTDYRHFDTGAIACKKLELTHHMQKFLNVKFTSYVKDKAIQESVLETNPVPEAECLKSSKVDGYLDEIFELLGK